jgi:hypothetical protein
MRETLVTLLLAPVMLVLVFPFGPYYLMGVFIWWLVKMAIDARYRKVTTMAFRTANETECVRCSEGMPVVLVYQEDCAKRLCDAHQKSHKRIHTLEARVLDEHPGSCTTAAVILEP